MKPEALGTRIKTAGLGAILSLVPVAFLELLRGAAGAAFSPAGASLRWGMVVSLLLVARAGAVWPAGPAHWFWPWRGVAIAGATAAVALGYAWSHATILAWLTLGGLYVLLLILAKGAWDRTAANYRRRVRLLLRAVVLGAAAAAAGSIPIAVGQIESHFADEEFFVLLLALALALFFVLLLAAHLRASPPPAFERPPRSGGTAPPHLVDCGRAGTGWRLGHGAGLSDQLLPTGSACL